jgi:hypothetical protein
MKHLFQTVSSFYNLCHRRLRVKLLFAFGCADRPAEKNTPSGFRQRRSARAAICSAGVAGAARTIGIGSPSPTSARPVNPAFTSSTASQRLTAGACHKRSLVCFPSPQFYAHPPAQAGKRPVPAPLQRNRIINSPTLVVCRYRPIGKIASKYNLSALRITRRSPKRHA